MSTMTGSLRVIAVALGMSVLVSFLAAGARAVSRLTSTPSVLLEAGDCQQPCWQGVQPGASSRYTVERQTYKWFDNPAAFFSSPYMASVGGQGDYLEMFALHTFGSGLTAGEVLRVFGQPDEIGCIHNVPSGKLLGSMGQSAKGANLYFADRQVEVSVVLPDTGRRLTPDVQVYAVCYYARPLVARTVPWRGFASLSAYPRCNDDNSTGHLDLCGFPFRSYSLLPGK
jgi:hypothetical protein